MLVVKPQNFPKQIYWKNAKNNQGIKLESLLPWDILLLFSGGKMHALNFSIFKWITLENKLLLSFKNLEEKLDKTSFF